MIPAGILTPEDIRVDHVAGEVMTEERRGKVVVRPGRKS